ncbi:MAG: hypothetical protein JWQ40_5064 [Segetibacter sp.]|jgi:hypothetical protein|nr:hypothetical protein [Segetibacter sp.]
MINRFYMPILKTKQGEFNALFSLNLNIQGYVVPLIEVAEIEFDNEENKTPKTIEEHLNTITKRIVNKWGRSNAFLDTHLVDDTAPGGVNPVFYIYDRLSKAAIAFPSLAVRLSTPMMTKKAIKEVMSRHNLKELAVRIFIADLVSHDFSTKLRDLTNDFGLTAATTHLVLDLADADFSNIEDFSDGLLDQLADFPSFMDWKSFTICGGSFPRTSALKSGVTEVPRGEWKFYKRLTDKLAKQRMNRHINYGDYGIVSPGHFKYDPLKMDRSANIRYTHNMIWYVVKGNSIKLNGNDQYYDLAKQIIDSDYYFNEHFSKGDGHLLKCGQRETKTAGNSTVWKRVGFNHHFTKVMSDLRASYLAS